MNYEEERTHRIWQTFLLITSVGCMAIGMIGITLLTLKPQWMHTIVELLSF